MASMESEPCVEMGCLAESLKSFLLSMPSHGLAIAWIWHKLSVVYLRTMTGGNESVVGLRREQS